jgi:hypothetical protein
MSLLKPKEIGLVVHNFLIQAYANAIKFEAAMQHYEVLCKNHKPNAQTFNWLFTVMRKDRRFDKFDFLQEEMKKHQIQVQSTQTLLKILDESNVTNHSHFFRNFSRRF